MGKRRVPPPPAPEARHGVHTSLRTKEVTAVKGVHLVQLLLPTPGASQGPKGPEPHLGLRAVAQLVGRMARPPPAPMPVDDKWPMTTQGYHHAPPPPPGAPHSTENGSPPTHLEMVGQADLQPRTLDRVAAMSDSDGSPRRDDRRHRQSRSLFPVSSGCFGEAPAEREERRLAEAAVLVGPPAGQPGAAASDVGLPAPEPVPAEEAPPASEVAARAALPPGGPPDVPPDGKHGTATAPQADHTAAPAIPPARGTGPTRAQSASPGQPQCAAAAAAGRTPSTAPTPDSATPT